MSRFQPHLLLFALLATTFAADGQSCYWRSQSQIISEPSGWFACNNTDTEAGGAQLCCLNGAYCGEDSICHTSDSGGGRSDESEPPTPRNATTELQGPGIHALTTTKAPAGSSAAAQTALTATLYAANPALATRRHGSSTTSPSSFGTAVAAVDATAHLPRRPSRR